MNQFRQSADQLRDNHPLTVMETLMKPIFNLNYGLRRLSGLALGACLGLGLAASPAMAAKNGSWLQKQQQQNGQQNAADDLQVGGNGPEPKITKIRFTKSAEQLGCKHVRFRIRLALWATDGFWDNPANPDVTDITGTVSSLKDTLPKGLSWENVSITGDIVNFPALAFSSVNHAKDTFEITGIKITADNSDGVGDPNLREWNAVAIAKIDPAEFPNPKIKKNQAKLRLVTPHSTFTAKSHHFGQPGPINWKNGKKTKFNVDLTDCDKPDDGGDPGGDPDGEPCIKFEKGEVECHGGPVAPFTYKMPVSPALAGTTIELTSLTPGVVVNPPFQIVPPGGGVLEWDLIGAAKGMTIHLLTNNVKQVGPADFDGVATCCTEEIIIDIPEDIPCDEEEKEPDLEVTKDALVPICEKGAGDCKFRIRVKNVGDEKYTGKLAIVDWNVPGGGSISAGPNFNWTCVQGFGTTYLCTHPSLTLNPGEFKDLNLSFKVGLGWPSDTLKNCARLEYNEMGVAPFGDLTNDKDCAEICIKGAPGCPDEDDDKEPKLELRKFDSGTVCEKMIGGACVINYSIIIHNFGDGDYNGALHISDSFDVKPDNVIFSPLPPWNCATVDGKNFDCTHPPTNIPANGQMILSVKARFNEAIKVEPKTITNCAKLQEGEDGKDKDCAQGTLPDGPADNGKEDISIEKTCEPGVLGGLISCRISVRNNGDRAPSGLIRIFDVARVIGTDAPLVSEDVTPDGPEWRCEGAPASDLACAIPGNQLQPGTTRFFVAKIRMSLSGNDRYRNCATMHHEPQIGGDMQMLGQSCFEGGVDIRVEKKLSFHCQQERPRCPFSITVKNVGKTDFNGKVKFADALGLAAEGLTIPITSIAPALPCDNPPTTVPFVCEGMLSLNAGESVSYNINLDFTGQQSLAPDAEMRNCAAVIAGDTAIGENNRGENPGGADGEFTEVVGCTIFRFSHDKEEEDQCTRPMVMSDNGVCVCPSGSRWNGRRCVGGDDTPPPVVVPDPLCVPGKGEIRTRDNRCICRADFIRKGPDLCVPPTRGCTPGPNEYKNRKGQCLCKRGYERNNYGICVKPPQSCKPGRNEIKTNNGRCVCKRGYTRNNKGFCVKSTPLCKLGPNEFRNSQGQCVCKLGYIHNKYGICIKRPTGCKPGRNEVKNAKGRCVCKQGYKRGTAGICVKIPTGCKPGRNEIKNSKGQCVCKTGFTRKKGYCVKIPTGCKPGPNEYKNKKGKCVCKRGYNRNKYGICIKKPVSTPKPTCSNGKLIKRGKGWYCVCPKGFKRHALKNGGARCSKQTVAVKPPCINGRLKKRGKGWYCSCNKGWKRKSIGKKGGASCQKPLIYKKPKKVFKPNKKIKPKTLKINPKLLKLKQKNQIK